MLQGQIWSLLNANTVSSFGSKKKRKPQFSKCPWQSNSLSWWNKLQNSCHGYKKTKQKTDKKKKTTTKETQRRWRRTWAHVHWYDRSTQLVTVSGTHKHATPEAQEAVCIPKDPRHTKHCEENTHTHALAHNHWPSTSWSSRVGRAPLVSQWTLLQPSWKMTQSDVSPATHIGDWTRWRRGDTTTQLTNIHTFKTILKVLLSSCYLEQS